MPPNLIEIYHSLLSDPMLDVPVGMNKEDLCWKSAWQRYRQQKSNEQALTLSADNKVEKDLRGPDLGESKFPKAYGPASTPENVTETGYHEFDQKKPTKLTDQVKPAATERISKETLSIILRLQNMVKADIKHIPHPSGKVLPTRRLGSSGHQIGHEGGMYAKPTRSLFSSPHHQPFLHNPSSAPGSEGRIKDVDVVTEHIRNSFLVRKATPKCSTCGGAVFPIGYDRRTQCVNCGRPPVKKGLPSIVSIPYPSTSSQVHETAKLPSVEPQAVASKREGGSRAHPLGGRFRAPETHYEAYSHLRDSGLYEPSPSTHIRNAAPKCPGCGGAVLPIGYDRRVQCVNCGRPPVKKAEDYPSIPFGDEHPIENLKVKIGGEHYARRGGHQEPTAYLHGKTERHKPFERLLTNLPARMHIQNAATHGARDPFAVATARAKEQGYDDFSEGSKGREIRDKIAEAIKRQQGIPFSKELIHEYKVPKKQQKKEKYVPFTSGGRASTYTPPTISGRTRGPDWREVHEDFTSSPQPKPAKEKKPEGTHPAHGMKSNTQAGAHRVLTALGAKKKPYGSGTEYTHPQHGTFRIQSPKVGSPKFMIEHIGKAYNFFKDTKDFSPSSEWVRALGRGMEHTFGPSPKGWRTPKLREEAEKRRAVPVAAKQSGMGEARMGLSKLELLKAMFNYSPSYSKRRDGYIFNPLSRRHAKYSLGARVDKTGHPDMGGFQRETPLFSLARNKPMKKYEFSNWAWNVGKQGLGLSPYMPRHTQPMTTLKNKEKDKISSAIQDAILKAIEPHTSSLHGQQFRTAAQAHSALRSIGAEPQYSGGGSPTRPKRPPKTGVRYSSRTGAKLPKVTSQSTGSFRTKYKYPATKYKHPVHGHFTVSEHPKEAKPFTIRHLGRTDEGKPFKKGAVPFAGKETPEEERAEANLRALKRDELDLVKKPVSAHKMEQTGGSLLKLWHMLKGRYSPYVLTKRAQYTGTDVGDMGPGPAAERDYGKFENVEPEPLERKQGSPPSLPPESGQVDKGFSATPRHRPDTPTSGGMGKEHLVFDSRRRRWVNPDTLGKPV